MVEATTATPRPTVHASFDLGTDLVDLKGKVIIVTGGNKGIGFWTVKQLLQAKAGKVYLAARSEERANEAIKALHDEGLGKEGSGSEVVWLRFDLSDPREAKRAAEDFMKKEDRLDVLINNAGDMSSREVGKDGVSLMHIINYISPYVFTETLLPLLKKTAEAPDSDVRIVNVASKMYNIVPSGVRYSTAQDFNVPYTFRPFSNLHRYGNSKLAMILWSQRLQRLLQPSEALPNGITVISLHPGGVDTFTPRVKVFQGLAKSIVSLFALTPEAGAWTSLFAAASKRVREERERYQADGGVYLVEQPVPGTVQELGATAKDENLAEELIRTTQTFLKDIGA
ncbi:NAD(P)-binding protein [Coprinellus micaceus]|uniref:NAD(P)-binding protein n=1 Tax=Coprinellus micaceus TaxID=71717 RepID=A0A4Y7T6S4_COPMI|nr:NAD(P)-binding protein [Coprinellus micaceus]